MFQEQLEEVKRELKKPSVKMADRVGVMESLAKMSEALVRAMQQTAKYVLASPQEGEDKGDVKGVEEVLKELMGGGKK